MKHKLLNARDEYITRIKSELLGPGSEISIPDKEHELISTAPQVRYSIGVLFPQENRLAADANDVATKLEDSAEVDAFDPVEVDDEQLEGNPSAPAIDENAEIALDVDDVQDDNLDEEISLAAQNMPSSIGITFFTKGLCSQVLCKIKFATYKSAIASDCTIPFRPLNPDLFTVPSRMETFVSYNKKTERLSLIAGGLTRGKIREFREHDSMETDAKEFEDALYKLSNQLQSGFVRVPHEVDIILDFGDGDYVDNNRALDETAAKVTALRRQVSDDIYSVTVMLVNDCAEKANGLRCLFQPEIYISSEQNTFHFQEYSGVTDFDLLDEEEQSLELQYHKKRVYATGLGTAANWNIDMNGVGIIFNDFFPESEVPSIDFNLPESCGVNPKALSMKCLSDLEQSITKEEKIAFLMSLISAYQSWINLQRSTISTLNPKYHCVANRNIDGCQESLDRMLSGVETLCKDLNAWQAFELSNRAMFMQRAHLKLQGVTASKDRFPYDDELMTMLDSIDYYTVDHTLMDRYAWRPFQIAFLLMSVNSIVEDQSVDRELVDLIWFPTGGGKTEAYLGLTAFTIFYRRLAHANSSDGTSVIMRYTLRLLAAQQFTRASTLICACEFIRHDAMQHRPKYGEYPLGNELISIGLWIGSAHTPNKNADAKKNLKKLSEAKASNLRNMKDAHNKFQVLKCPWCGTKLVREVVNKKMVGIFGYRMKNNRRFECFCPQESCFFGQQDTLPIQIVDEELYRNPPTLLFGTVDKFAMMPWKKEIGAFFAVSSENRAPELIIQDELHLISGPLGTMVGLYETVIDALCEASGVKTKIVASTATIRRAKEQCSALYNREVRQFPHPSLDAADSFFAREARTDYEQGVFGRKYVGILPSGKSKAMMEVRSISALMQSINVMNLDDKVRDKFWTLTVYFNSLKDLGKCTTLVDDDVKDFIKRTAFRLGTNRDARKIFRADELTSRVSTTELNETLDKLEKLSYSKENIDNKRYPSNILLATNMISVGIDVARLNVMLLVGQPKLTSEYIQASSRVGREFPGVAFVMYDGTKSRDRSHYEQFKSYHDSFYRFVEPTGATPFSKPARDRALHAVVIALLRMLEPQLTSELGAGTFSILKYAQSVERIKQLLVSRSSGIAHRLGTGMVDESGIVAEEVESILERWEVLASNYLEEQFSYGEKYLVSNPEDGYGRLMKPFRAAPQDTEAYDTMTSMRNVDATVASNVLIWEN